jgi:hypothetical protein
MVRFPLAISLNAEDADGHCAALRVGAYHEIQIPGSGRFRKLRHRGKI